MNGGSKNKNRTKAMGFIAGLIALGLVTGSTLMYGAIVSTYASPTFVGAAIVHVQLRIKRYRVQLEALKIHTDFTFPHIQEMDT